MFNFAQGSREGSESGEGILADEIDKLQVNWWGGFNTDILDEVNDQMIIIMDIKKMFKDVGRLRQMIIVAWAALSCIDPVVAMKCICCDTEVLDWVKTNILSDLLWSIQT